MPFVLSGLHLGRAVIVNLPGEPIVDYQIHAQSLVPGGFVAVALLVMMPVGIRNYHAGGQFVLAYCLGHVSGEKIEGEYPLAAGNPQVMGGQITYARRYAPQALARKVAAAHAECDRAAAVVLGHDQPCARVGDVP